MNESKQRLGKESTDAEKNQDSRAYEAKSIPLIYQWTPLYSFSKTKKKNPPKCVEKEQWISLFFKKVGYWNLLHMDDR